MDVVALGLAKAASSPRLSNLSSGLLRPVNLDPLRDLPNLLAWLDASTLAGNNGDAISAFPATFGGFTLNIAPTTKPTLLAAVQNGRNALRFGPSAYLRNTATFGAVSGLNQPTGGYAQPVSFAFVFRLSTYSTSGNAGVMGNSGVAINVAAAGLTFYPFAGASPAVQGPPVNDGAWHVAIVNFGNANWSFYLDGYLAGAQSTQAQGTGALAGGLFLGPGLGGTPAAGSNTDIAEVLICQSLLSGARADLVTRGLAAKWGIS